MKFDVHTLIETVLSLASESSGVDRAALTIAETLYPDKYPGADLDGWTLYAVVENYPVGQTIYVALHLESGQAKVVESSDLENDG
jgi:hypothetical protein